MADQDAQDRNLPASARKLKKAREEGQVARSRDLGHFAMLGVCTLLLTATAPQASDTLRHMLSRALRFSAQDLLDSDVMLRRLSEALQAWVWVALPMGVALTLAAIVAGVACGGLLWTLKPIGPKFDKLNPLTGVGRLLSKDQLIETLKSCVIALALGLVGGLFLRAHIDTFAGHLNIPLPQALQESAGTLLKGLTLLVMVLAVCATIDVPLQRWRLAQQLKMSQEDVKKEFKEQEGNPEIKGRLKARMRELAGRRMLQAVPSADLVVMNPTHYAVALKYDEGRMSAPRVVAKGADLLAMKIRDTAQDAKVPVLQAPVLARALYAHADLDREIPMALYSAVAQVLAYVYQLRAATEGKAPEPGSLPELPVPPELDPHHGRQPAA